MADNNSYEINVTLDDFNGIITKNPNGDGTYNVTYTSLTKDQINEIGQQFAKHLSDTDENGNSKVGLHKVALTGDYAQLENKPSTSNLQGFKKVAFSGKTSDLTNDSGFLTINTNAYTGSPASTITQNHINKWDSKVNTNDLAPIATTGNYTDLNGAPSLPEDINNEGHAYETINNQRQLKTLKDIAFTGDYNDLINIPSTVNSLLSLNLFEKEDNLADNNQLYQLGETNTYITDFDQFTAIVNSELTLATVIQNMALNNLNNGKSIYLKNNQTSYFVNKIELITTNDTIQYIKFIIYTMRDNFDITLNSNNAQNQLNNLNLVPVLKCIIFDYINNIIYCKIHDI